MRHSKRMVGSISHEMNPAVQPPSLDAIAPHALNAPKKMHPAHMTEKQELDGEWPTGRGYCYGLGAGDESRNGTVNGWVTGPVCGDGLRMNDGCGNGTGTS